MKIVKTLKSRRYAVTFIILIILSLVLGTAIPQRPRMSREEWSRFYSNHPQLVKILTVTGLDHIYTTWWFLTIVALFSLNLGLNLSERIKISYRQFKNNRFLNSSRIKALPLNATFFISEEDLLAIENVAHLLKGFRYKVVRQENQIMAVKGKMGYWWVPLFHASLLIVLLGVLISGVFKFSGTLELSEGQIFSGRNWEFINRWYGLSGYRPEMDFSIRLKSFKAEYWDGKHPKLYQSIFQVLTRDGDAYIETVEMNKPFRKGGYTFYQSKYWGYSALFGLSKNNSGVEAKGYVNLPYRKHYRGKRLKQTFVIPGTGLIAHLEYKPESDNIKIEIKDGIKVIFNGVLKKGESADLGSYTLRFHDMVKWTGFYISFDPGVGVVYSGFAILLFSALGMAFIYPRRLWVSAEGGRMAVGAEAGRGTEAYREEFEGIVEKVKEVMR